jgi:hypothetical protein
MTRTQLPALFHLLLRRDEKSLSESLSVCLCLYVSVFPFITALQQKYGLTDEIQKSCLY